MPQAMAIDEQDARSTSNAFYARLSIAYSYTLMQNVSVGHI